MIKTKFVILSKHRFSEADKEGIIKAIIDLYKEKEIEEYYIEEKLN